MVTQMTAQALLDILLGMDGAFILENPHGAMELRGTDLYMSHANNWVTIYHKGLEDPESRSHFHLKWRTLKWAQVGEEEGQTPHLAFFSAPEPDGDPLLVWYFPSFYDWAQNKAEILAHKTIYETFVQDYGTKIQLVEPVLEMN